MFDNKQIDISTLPQVAQVDFKNLHPKYKTVVGIRLLIASIFILLLSSSPYIFQHITNSLPISDIWLVSICGVGVLLVILMCIISLKGVQMKGYALREHDIIYKTGIISRSQTVIPFNRVQHVVVYEGALLRVFGLCTVEFFTAGGALGDLKISGISKEEGERLKAYVIQKITKSVKPALIVEEKEYKESEIERINETE
ncbi:PH domain-containing protein [Myroides marinus]|uniref:PH domain-containing protein n=1 Tax=Myroides marinus TaxID=703342 RepID=UPI002578D0A0|nr:PH domain-containing protein [Myroides marinus]MDM1347936.1 PH domain-containing protein [Myroides marinus]MDM1351508.1 PH domain-containing protein [Myroides marinus]MDM1356031.1 PH domain-containing protein [Myroides marinus]MDM1358753.1 PH domain-containing protein [Myroides marinus]MDM1364522.1 PH domain-containing protein [Myroides marinus]